MFALFKFFGVELGVRIYCYFANLPLALDELI
jgi:hypothetical protein